MTAHINRKCFAVSTLPACGLPCYVTDNACKLNIYQSNDQFRKCLDTLQPDWSITLIAVIEPCVAANNPVGPFTPAPLYSLPLMSLQNRSNLLRIYCIQVHELGISSM